MTKKMKEYYVEEMLEATTQVEGYDNSRLVMAILNKFEAEVRMDQSDKLRELLLKNWTKQ